MPSTLCPVFLVLLSLGFLSSGLAARFALIPMFGRSHYRFFNRFGQELAERGHEVDMYVGAFVGRTYAANNSFVRWFRDDSFSRTDVTAPTASERRTFSWYSLWPILWGQQSAYCDDILSDAEAMKEVAKADLVIGEYIYMCSSLIADKFSLPHVVLSATLLSYPPAFAYSVPIPPSYVPLLGTAFSLEMSFLERVLNTIQWIALYNLHSYWQRPTYNRIKTKHNISPDKSIDATLGRVDMIISQMLFMIEHPRPQLPNTRMVGPLLPSPPKTLPDALEQFMQESGDEGVILVSFGSVLIGFDESVLRVMAKAFSKLQQKVIWKLTPQGKFQAILADFVFHGSSLRKREKFKPEILVEWIAATTIDIDSNKISVSDNVMVSSWLPQNDILGHPKTRLFIGHGGVFGTFESMYHAVPMICAPFSADQFDNAQAAKHLGLGEITSLGSATVGEFVGVINKVLSKSSYRDSAARVSRSIKLLPRHPVKEAADWVEYTQAQGGLPYLRPRGLYLPFYQLYLLDILLVTLFILVVAFVATRLLIKVLLRCLLRSQKKEKSN